MTDTRLRIHSRTLTAGLFVALLGLGSTSALAAEAQDPNWPCVNRKVPELTAAAIWDGPPITDTKSWHSDDKIRKLSEYLISRRVKEEDAEKAIKKFADSLPPDKRDAKLTELFAAVLTRTNESRKVVLHGIERFSKAQHKRADEIQKEQLKLSPEEEEETQIDNPAGQVLPGQLTDAQEKYKWEIRAFHLKEANIPIACEIPQLIDQRAGDIARAIRAEMSS